MTLPQLITTKQQEAREQFSHEFGRGAYEEVVHEKMLPVLDALILSTAHSVLDAVKEETVLEKRQHEKTGSQANTRVRNMDVGWNTYRDEQLSRLERFSSNETST